MTRQQQHFLTMQNPFFAHLYFYPNPQFRSLHWGHPTLLGFTKNLICLVIPVFLFAVKIS